MDSETEKIATDALNAAFSIHTEFGPGLLERVYQLVLANKLKRLGYQVECEVPVSFVYEGEKFDDAFRVDIFVNRKLVIELKSSEGMNPVYGKQVLTYLRLMKLPLGLLINFGMAHLKDGIKRIAN